MSAKIVDNIVDEHHIEIDSDMVKRVKVSSSSYESSASISSLSSLWHIISGFVVLTLEIFAFSSHLEYFLRKSYDRILLK